MAPSDNQDCTMADDDNNDKVAAAGGGEEDEEEEEDLEKLSAEIARMEEEAARIAAETEELERANSKGATTTKPKSSGGGDAHSEEKIKKDGCVIMKIMCAAQLVLEFCICNAIFYVSPPFAFQCPFPRDKSYHPCLNRPRSL